jgi:RNA polymerase sigma-70 factor (ECF subfamily)
MMPARTAESTIELPSPVAIEREPATDASAIDEDVLLLFDEFRDPLLRYVCAFGISIRDGEDLVQDVFLALFRHLQQQGLRSNLRGWLFRVAHNLALKFRARQQQQRSNFVSIRDARTTLDLAPDPERTLANGRRHARLLAAFSALPERDQRCVRLRGEGFRYREIARVLGISLGAVSKSLTRTIRRLERASER